MNNVKILLKQGNIFNPPLKTLVNKDDGLVKLADLIDWDYFDNEYKHLINKKTGNHHKPIRLIIGLIILKNAYNLSDENLIFRLNRNVYFQYFCGASVFQKDPLLCRTTLVKWRTKLGTDNLEKILQKTVGITKKLGILKKKKKVK